jgi:hypothetical protein
MCCGQVIVFFFTGFVLKGNSVNFGTTHIIFVDLSCKNGCTKRENQHDCKDKAEYRFTLHYDTSFLDENVDYFLLRLQSTYSPTRISKMIDMWPHIGH